MQYVFIVYCCDQKGVQFMTRFGGNTYYMYLLSFPKQSRSPDRGGDYGGGSPYRSR